jgi:hypothetical protein
MAVRSKTGTSPLQRKEPKPKTTSIGQGLMSRPRRRNNRKKLRGQGR